MNKVYHYDGKDLPLKDRATLLEASWWISDYVPPVPDKFKVFTKSFIETRMSQTDAQQALIYDLMSGRLQAEGLVGIERATWDEFDFRPKFPHEIAKIQSTDWIYDDVFWIESGLPQEAVQLYDDERQVLYVGGYCKISIPTDKLMELYPAPSHIKMQDKQITSPPIYQPKFLNLMMEAIQHFSLTNENQISTKILIPWFEDRLRNMGETAPNNKAKMMATFVRTPESQKGGNKKTTKPAKGL